jgi:hypothetical protein
VRRQRAPHRTAVRARPDCPGSRGSPGLLRAPRRLPAPAAAAARLLPLGRLLTAFVGVCVYAFYPPPAQHEREIRELSRSERAIRDSRPPGELTEAERAHVLELVVRRDALSDAAAGRFGLGSPAVQPVARVG